MRSPTRTALTAAAVAACAVAWSGCEAKKQTEYVAGISTQVQVPRDLKAIRLDVSVGGAIQFCRSYRVYDGKVQLPRSLGQLPALGKPGPDPITETVTGFTEEYAEASGKRVFDDCNQVAPKVGAAAGQGARILRRSRQPYVADSILFLPMPLKYSCFDTDCGSESETCKAGRCVDARIDETKLPKYSDELLDGTGGACFRAAQCFAAGVPPAVVNADDCTFAVPNTPSAPPELPGAPPNPFPSGGDGVNVEVTYDGGLNREILDKDPQEGFTIPDPTKPQQFRLAPGLCDLLKGYRAPDAANPDGVPTAHRITAIRASGICQAKGPFQPLCAADQLAAMQVDPNGLASNPSPPSGCAPTEVKPAQAVLMLLADDTQNSKAFYEKATRGAIELSFADPAFQKTEIGLTLFPGAGSCGANGSWKTLEPALARKAKDSILTKFAEIDTSNPSLLKPLGTPVSLDGALRDTYAALSADRYKSYYRRAALVIGNRGFGDSACGALPKDLAAAALSGAGQIRTYALALVSDASDVGAVLSPGAPRDFAVAGGGTDFTDSRTGPANGRNLFNEIVKNLATCVYDVVDPATRPKQGDLLTYSDPVSAGAVTSATLGFRAECSKEDQGTEDGFGPDPINSRRVFLCKKSCDAYRGVLAKSQDYAALTGQPALAVPMFVHKQGCDPQAAGSGIGAPNP
jgi:hypothetical protein